ncbi:MAG: signal peptidase II [Vampirovibrionales bacterium]|nr:signal peptidase II [Vampirovibrionales bacterium]
MESPSSHASEPLVPTGGCPLRCLVGPNASIDRSAWVVTTAVLLLLDQRLKAWAIQTLVDPVVVVPKVFQLHLTWNTGVAFGLLRAWPQAALWASSLLTLGLLLYAWKTLSKQSPLGFNPHWAFLSCLSAGALSNGYDRWVRGAVVDFIDVMAIQYPVFNGADVLVCVGVVGLLYQLMVTQSKSSSTSLPTS